jgi:hypothetical protein
MPPFKMAVMADLQQRGFAAAALPHPAGGILAVREDFGLHDRRVKPPEEPAGKGGNEPAKDGLQPGIDAKSKPAERGAAFRMASKDAVGRI